MSSNSLVHAAAGAGSGLISLAVTYPLYTATVTLQAQSKSIAQSNDSDDDELIQRRQYATIIGTLNHLLREHGISGWYPGLRAALLANTVQSSVFYYFFSLCKNLHGVSNEPAWQMLIGLEAGILNVILTNPLWVINTRQMTMQKHTHLRVRRLSAADDVSDQLNELDQQQVNSWRVCARHIYNTEGFSGFYSGVVAAIALTTNPASQFAIYEILKKWLITLKLYIYSHRHQLMTTTQYGQSYTPALSSIDIFILGAVAKMLSTILTYPLQTIKTQMQKQNTEHKTLSDAIINLSRGGLQSFYSGMSSKVLQTAVTAAFLFLFYDGIVDIVVKLLERRAKRLVAR